MKVHMQEEIPTFLIFPFFSLREKKNVLGINDDNMNLEPFNLQQLAYSCLSSKWVRNLLSHVQVSAHSTVSTKCNVEDVSNRKNIIENDTELLKTSKRFW